MKIQKDNKLSEKLYLTALMLKDPSVAEEDKQQIYNLYDSNPEGEKIKFSQKIDKALFENEVNPINPTGNENNHNENQTLFGRFIKNKEEEAMHFEQMLKEDKDYFKGKFAKAFEEFIRDREAKATHRKWKEEEE